MIQLRRHLLGVELLLWRALRLALQVVGATPEFRRSSAKRVLLITGSDRISQSQMFPFFLYRHELRRAYDVAFREISFDAFEGGRVPVQEADIVLLQTWFTLGAERLRKVCEQVHARARPKRVAFMDGFAHTDLRLAEVLDPYVNLYVKKHLFRNRAEFTVENRGDTNLMTYFGARYGIAHDPVRWNIPPGFLDKLVLGPGFVTTPDLLTRLCAPEPPDGPRPIGVHARLGSKGSGWYTAMRRESAETIARVRGGTVVSGAGVKYRQYLRELTESQLCYSPFGYGEVAWRDVEAVACGAVLVKPDMSHLATDPDLFVANETYLPVKWDFSDTVERVDALLGDPDRRRHIATVSHRVARDYLLQARFVPQMRRVLE